METMENHGQPAAAYTGPDVSKLHDEVWEWLKQDKHPIAVGCGQFPIFAEDPLVECHKKLDEYLEQARIDTFSWKILPKQFPAGAAILAAPSRDKLAFLRAIVVRILFHKRAGKKEKSVLARLADQFLQLNRIAVLARLIKNPDAQRFLEPSTFGTLVSELLRSGLPFVESDLAAFIDISAGEYMDPYFFENLPPDAILRAVEQSTAHPDFPRCSGKSCSYGSSSFKIQTIF